MFSLEDFVKIKYDWFVGGYNIRGQYGIIKTLNPRQSVARVLLFNPPHFALIRHSFMIVTGKLELVSKKCVQN